MASAKLGRKQKPYQTSWGEIIPGLARQGNDGRWRIVATGFRFTEPDERKAIERFYRLQGRPMSTMTAVEVTLADILPDVPAHLDDLTGPHVDRLDHFYDAAGDQLDETTMFEDGRMAEAPYRINVPDSILWPWMRRMLLERPEYMAKMTGLERLARFADFTDCIPTIKLSQIRAFYEAENPSKNKNAKFRIWDAMVEFTGAKMLADLTKERLSAYRDTIEKSETIKAGCHPLYGGRRRYAS